MKSHIDQMVESKQTSTPLGNVQSNNFFNLNRKKKKKETFLRPTSAVLASFLMPKKISVRKRSMHACDDKRFD